MNVIPFGRETTKTYDYAADVATVQGDAVTHWLRWAHADPARAVAHAEAHYFHAPLAALVDLDAIQVLGRLQSLAGACSSGNPGWWQEPGIPARLGTIADILSDASATMRDGKGERVPIRWRAYPVDPEMAYPGSSLDWINAIMSEIGGDPEPPIDESLILRVPAAVLITPCAQAFELWVRAANWCFGDHEGLGARSRTGHCLARALASAYRPDDDDPDVVWEYGEYVDGHWVDGGTVRAIIE